MSKKEEEVVRGNIGSKRKKNDMQLVRGKEKFSEGKKKKRRLVTSIVGTINKYVLLKNINTNYKLKLMFITK